MAKAKVILFKDSGKYYTEEEWEIPKQVPHVDKLLAKIGITSEPLGPWDMIHSTDFRRIGNGAVLVPTQEPWGYPFLIQKYLVEENDK